VHTHDDRVWIQLARKKKNKILKKKYPSKMKKRKKNATGHKTEAFSKRELARRG
jgi:hypothetical protein